jgi:hypothetical protein
MLRLASRCPKCEVTERRRLFAWELARWLDEHPERPIETVQCHRCHTVYVVRAKHYQRAVPDS